VPVATPVTLLTPKVIVVVVADMNGLKPAAALLLPDITGRGLPVNEIVKVHHVPDEIDADPVWTRMVPEVSLPASTWHVAEVPALAAAVGLVGAADPVTRWPFSVRTTAVLLAVPSVNVPILAAFVTVSAVPAALKVAAPVPSILSTFVLPLIKSSKSLDEFDWVILKALFVFAWISSLA